MMNNITAPVHYARAARLTLALLDGQDDDVVAVVEEACKADEGNDLVLALALGLGELLVGTAGPENARATLRMAALDAEMEA